MGRYGEGYPYKRYFLFEGPIRNLARTPTGQLGGQLDGGAIPPRLCPAAKFFEPKKLTSSGVTTSDGHGPHDKAGREHQGGNT